jgi:hypothetical protein
MAKLRLIDRWAAFTDDELLTLEGALDRVEAHTPVDRVPVAMELLADEIDAEIQRRDVGGQGAQHG